MERCRGQILIPALFLFPTFFLFIFLIFETAKVSREKIRHQFAIDSAAFVEMTNYSDFLNRSAYVNGAFPMRIFREGFAGTQLDNLGRDCGEGQTQIALDDLLYRDGVFPRDPDNPERQEFAESDRQWKIRFDPEGNRAGMNDLPPEVASTDGTCNRDRCVTLISRRTAQCWNINWQDANQIYKLYVQIYKLLGQVESAQYSVLNRLAREHNFLKKSYWLNMGGDTALREAEDAVTSFRPAADSFLEQVDFHCAQYLYFHGNQLQPRWEQPYVIVAPDEPQGPDKWSPEGGLMDRGCDGGLFQLVTVEPSILNGMAAGWPAETRWTLNPQGEAKYNYWNVDLDNTMLRLDRGPRVRARIAVAGFGTQASVWPDPTPKYQVRLYP
ncbi:MAG: hypothetical protein HY549_06860 [Elusimicrobia bacterium]|nr:hypothetical protein [Elusimicrobiota bacterium]